MEFHKTSLGKKFYETDFPRAVNALEKIADALNRTTEIQEKDEKKKKIDQIKENKKTRIGAINEKVKSKLDFKKGVMLKKLLTLKENGESYFDEDYLKKMLEDGS